MKTPRHHTSHTHRTHMAALLACAAGLACVYAPAARAGGGEENAVIIIDPSSVESMYIGNYYKNARNIPDSNVLYIDPDSVNYAAFVSGVLPGLAGQIKNVRLGDHIDYIVVTPGNNYYVSAPGYVTDGCSPVTRFSMSSVFAMAFVTGDILPGGLSSQNANRYFTTQASCPPLGFDSNTTWSSGSPSTVSTARRYYIGAMLGWIDPPGTPAPTGNTLAEIVSMIDRSVSADGTHPVGTFYYMNNTGDPIRNVRACGNTQGCTGTPTLYNTAVNTLASLGATGMVMSGELPLGKFDCLGVMTGSQFPNVGNPSYGLMPGSFGDHLTSYAARFDFGQEKVAAWTRKGASASSGTVEEPCNYPGKFPHSRFHPYYWQGMSLGEAYLRNQQYTPFQNILYGDPLTRPFTYIPTVNLAGVPGGAASGTVVLTPSASTTRPATSIASMDLLIDGVLYSSTTPGGTFNVDTTRLADGWHDLRVLAFDNTVTKSMGRWVGGMTTDNRGHATGISALTPSGDLATNYQFSVTPSGGTASEVRLLLNGRVVASAAGGGIMSVKGQSLGAGQIYLQAETTFNDGFEARSVRVPVNVAFAAGTPGGAAPVAYSYTKTVVRDSAFVVELPASLDTDPSGASYSIVTPPVQATVTAGGTNAYRLLTPIGTPCGTDSMVFRVTTSSGVSNDATVTIVYTAPYKVCPADFNDDGFADGIDYDQFNNAFEAGLPSADFNNDCFIDGIDYDQFNTEFEKGC